MISSFDLFIFSFSAFLVLLMLAKTRSELYRTIGMVVVLTDDGDGSGSHQRPNDTRLLNAKKKKKQVPMEVFQIYANIKTTNNKICRNILFAFDFY